MRISLTVLLISIVNSFGPQSLGCPFTCTDPATQCEDPSCASAGCFTCPDAPYCTTVADISSLHTSGQTIHCPPYNTGCLNSAVPTAEAGLKCTGPCTVFATIGNWCIAGSKWGWCARYDGRTDIVTNTIAHSCPENCGTGKARTDGVEDGALLPVCANYPPWYDKPNTDNLSCSSQGPCDFSIIEQREVCCQEPPTTSPTLNPSAEPTTNPSANPTMVPSTCPTQEPTVHPSFNPTMSPSVHPTLMPSASPSINPTMCPTHNPTINPSNSPTSSPSMTPSMTPSTNPTMMPSSNPSAMPSSCPSMVPTHTPTAFPSMNPTLGPTVCPTTNPSSCPSMVPSTNPTACPSSFPTINPTNCPSAEPTTSMPSLSPTKDCAAFTDAQTCIAEPYCAWFPGGAGTTERCSRRCDSYEDQRLSQTFIDDETNDDNLLNNLQPSITYDIINCARECVDGFSNPDNIFPNSDPQPCLLFTFDELTSTCYRFSGHTNEDDWLNNALEANNDWTTAQCIETSRPTQAPTTTLPSGSPTNVPSDTPSVHPTNCPSFSPTSFPSMCPSMNPSMTPSVNPTLVPSTNPTTNPSMTPSINPTTNPTRVPSMNPTLNPTMNPTFNPTLYPTSCPSTNPSATPSVHPSMNPTMTPSFGPTSQPTAVPSTNPTSNPTMDPTFAPTANPTIFPTTDPSANPTFNPTSCPSTCPSLTPTAEPTVNPTMGCTDFTDEASCITAMTTKAAQAEGFLTCIWAGEENGCLDKCGGYGQKEGNMAWLAFEEKVWSTTGTQNLSSCFWTLTDMGQNIVSYGQYDNRDQSCTLWKSHPKWDPSQDFLYLTPNPNVTTFLCNNADIIKDKCIDDNYGLVTYGSQDLSDITTEWRSCADLKMYCDQYEVLNTWCCSTCNEVPSTSPSVAPSKAPSPGPVSSIPTVDPTIGGESCPSWQLSNAHEDCHATCGRSANYPYCVEGFWPNTSFEFQTEIMPRVNTYGCSTYASNDWDGNPSIYDDPTTGSRTCNWEAALNPDSRCHISDPNRSDLRICCCTHVNQTATERPQSRKIATDSSDSIMDQWWIWVVIGAAVCCWCCLCAFIIFACSKEEEKTFTKGHDDGLEYGGDFIMGVDEDSGPVSGDVEFQTMNNTGTRSIY